MPLVDLFEKARILPVGINEPILSLSRRPIVFVLPSVLGNYLIGTVHDKGDRTRRTAFRRAGDVFPASWFARIWRPGRPGWTDGARARFGAKMAKQRTNA